jgi:hypothetical protein
MSLAQNQEFLTPASMGACRGPLIHHTL